MQYRHTALVLAALVTVAACSDDDDDDGPTGNQGQATVRVVNASSANATVSVLNGNTTLAPSVAFGTAGSCVTVPAGSQTLTFRSGTTNVAATAATPFTANTKYTVVLTGSGATAAATVLPDAFTAPTAGNNVVRFVNATGTAGDVFLTTADGAGTGTPTAGNIGAGAFTTFASSANTNVRARLFDVGTTATPRADVTITGVTNGPATVVFTPAIAAGGSTGFVVQPCT